MQQHCKINLIQIKELLRHLNDEQYAMPLAIFSGSSIGQHTRHILEFYTCLLQNVITGVVNYDLRERNLDLENNRQIATNKIDNLCRALSQKMPNSPIVLEADFDTDCDGFMAIDSSFYRELAYCLEHSIHHQALLKIGIASLNLGHIIDADFGIAPSTIRHKKSSSLCVQ